MAYHNDSAATAAVCRVADCEDHRTLPASV